MEKQKRVRREKTEIRAALEEKRNYHLAQAQNFADRIAKMDEPPKPRFRKPSVSSVMNAAKDDFSPEELLAILERAREQKRAMGAE